MMHGILELADLTLEAPAIPPLPSEVVDFVIDQLEQDKTTLKVCSLVCRSWLPRTRHHLFSTFNIRTRLISAIDLLRSPLCTIQPHVRKLKLSIDTLDTAPMATCIQELANGGSNLLSLTMKTVFGSGMTLVDDRFQALFSTPILKNFRYLKLKYFCFKSLSDEIRSLSSLPALESLALYGVNSRTENDQNAYTMPPPPNLQHLFIWTIGVPHELCWLAIYPRHPLTALHLYNVTSAGYLIALDYLRQSSQLQYLSFSFSFWEIHGSHISDFEAQVDLTSQRDLRCLRINYARAVPFLSKLLPQIPSHIEEIAISLAGFHASFAWADLRKPLMSPAARSLKRLYVNETHIHDILEALPEFASRGVILPLHMGWARHDRAQFTGYSVLAP